MSLMSVDDYEQKAKEILPRVYYIYYRSGAGAELTLEWNKTAFEKIRFKPRVLRDVYLRSMATRVLDMDFDIPFGIAPTASHKLAHRDGEIATAKAAAKFKTVYIMSSSCNTPIEDVAAAAPNTIKWMQTYSFGNKQLTQKIVKSAEKYGFKAIVLTVDMPAYGIRRVEAKAEFLLPEHIELTFFEGFDVHNKHGDGPMAEQVINSIMNPKLTWDDVKEYIRSTKLPVILKGILTSEDAELAIEVGAKGIIVSNHGARQLDGVQATIEALPDIVKVVRDRIPVMMDGGVRDGADVYKALALGAKMVFLGRPILWGLTVDGQKGVESILDIVKHELDVTMALCGTPSLDKISKDYIVCGK